MNRFIVYRMIGKRCREGLRFYPEALPTPYNQYVCLLLFHNVCDFVTEAVYIPVGLVKHIGLEL